MSWYFIMSCSLFSQIISGQEVTRLDGSKVAYATLNKEIAQLMQAADVHGMAISIFNDHKPVYQQTFGYKNAVTKEPIKSTTNIYGASFSKAVFAVLVLKLVEEGVLDLDTPLQSYLPQPIYTYTPKTRWHDDYRDLQKDSLYPKITARMCLVHTSGFPNWRWDEEDHKLRVTFPPGSRYSYSGEGMVYLQVVLEKMLDRSLETLMQEKVFQPLGMKQTSYTWQPEFEEDYVVGHNTSGELYQKDKDNEPRSASTLETTLEDYTLFIKGVLKHTVLSPASTELMFTPQIRLRSVQQFGPLRFKETTAQDAIDLSYGLGWGVLHTPYGRGAFKEGHGNGFQHYSIIFPQKGIGVIIMTNSDNGESIFKELLSLTIGDTFTPWFWQNYIPYQNKNKVQP